MNCHLSCTVIIHKASVQPRPQPKPTDTIWFAAIQPHVALVCLLVVSTSIIHVNIATHTPTPRGMEGRVAQLAEP